MVVYKVRKELNLNSPGNFKAMFIEIILPDRKNLIIGCVYRHGSGIPLLDFTNEHLEPILETISKKNEECMLMGDFNIDLLKCNENNSAGDFFNMFASYFFSPLWNY